MDYLRVPRYRAERGVEIAEANTAYPKHFVSEEDEDVRDQQLEMRQLSIDTDDAYPAHLIGEYSHTADEQASTTPQGYYADARSNYHPLAEEQPSTRPVVIQDNEFESSTSSQRDTRRKKKKKSSSRSRRSKRPQGYVYDYENNSPNATPPAVTPAAGHMYSYTPAPLPRLPQVVDTPTQWEAYLSMFSTASHSAYPTVSAVGAQYGSLLATYSRWNDVAAQGYYVTQPGSAPLAQAQAHPETSRRARHDSISISDSDSE